MDFINALKIIEKFIDLKIGLVDALSFSYIERNKIKSIEAINSFIFFFIFFSSLFYKNF
ncbi:MAG: hypothetical protein NTV16_10310 [Actinobacteria bacterium]|nr:hypothetical protein [Actinomycetota bacterium]